MIYKTLQDAVLLFNPIHHSPIRVIAPGEKANKISLSKSIYSKTQVKKNDLLELSSLDFYPSGEGLSPMQIQSFLTTPLCKNLPVDVPITIDYFVPSHQRKTYTNKHLGIPVRYRDYNNLSQLIDVHYYEFHLTKGDLKYSDFRDLNLSSKLTYGVHAPDVYDNNLIFDPFLR